MKRLFTLILSLAVMMTLFPATTWAAPEWPANIAIEAEGGIVIDADTGAVLYGKNIHEPYFPASITKILTALLVIENCDLDETVTFSHNAVYNVEANSTSAGLDEGDELSVRDCLYALVLKSANEVANALAEHVSGTTEEFALLMNEKAKSLGCVDSNFANPSGLNDPNHYTSAYDMALIGQAALKNELFVEIDSTLYYDLPVTKRNPDGARIYPGHKMIKKNESVYYDGAFGGKTGYTSLAGNTLVTFAKRDGRTLVTVILNGHQTHYSDTKKLLDFGFENFQTVIAADYDNTYTSIENDMTIAGLAASDLSGLMLDRSSKVTIPKNSDFSAVTSSITYDLTDEDPSDAIAKIQYSYGQRNIGATYLKLEQADKTIPPVPATTLEEIAGITLESTEAPVHEPVEKEPFSIPAVVWIVLAVLLVLGILIGGFLLIKAHLERKELEERAKRRERRLQRLQDGGFSSAEFDLLMEQKRSSYTAAKRPRRRKNKKFPFMK